jgi:hypothetical protein
VYTHKVDTGTRGAAAATGSVGAGMAPDSLLGVGEHGDYRAPTSAVRSGHAVLVHNAWTAVLV